MYLRRTCLLKSEIHVIAVAIGSLLVLLSFRQATSSESNALVHILMFFLCSLFAALTLEYVQRVFQVSTYCFYKDIWNGGGHEFLLGLVLGHTIVVSIV